MNEQPETGEHTERMTQERRMDTSAGMTLEAWAQQKAGAAAQGSTASAHFDEIVTGVTEPDIRTQCELVLERLLDAVRATGEKGFRAGISVSLEFDIPLPSVTEAFTGWEYIKKQVREIEPPSVHLIPAIPFLGARHPEEHIYSFSCEIASVDSCLKFVRDIGEINEGEGYWGCAYFLADF